jgi:hypothetical protein
MGLFHPSSILVSYFAKIHIDFIPPPMPLWGLWVSTFQRVALPKLSKHLNPKQHPVIWRYRPQKLHGPIKGSSWAGVQSIVKTWESLQMLTYGHLELTHGRSSQVLLIEAHIQKFHRPITRVQHYRNFLAQASVGEIERFSWNVYTLTQEWSSMSI